MIEFNKPLALNGFQLRQELIDAGIELPDEKNAILIEDNSLFLAIDATKKNEAKIIIDAHIGQEISNPRETAILKLAALGLTPDDLKALGL